MTEDEFSDWIVDEMDKRGLDVKALAKKTGVCKTIVYAYIKGERLPNMYTFSQLLKVFGLKMQIVEGGK